MHLYITGTPIGNLDDMTYRAIETLKKVDVILCEDTRVTKKLLNHFKITTPMQSYHDFNKMEVEDHIIQKMHEGQTFALVSDAGMPVISDPGYELIHRMQQESLNYEVIPGPSAFTLALIGSGIESYEFTYFGFLPKSNKKRNEKLKEIMNHNKTSVLYESPHKLEATIKAMANIDASRVVSISREITKKFEQHYNDTLENLLNVLNHEIPLKGECVIVVSKCEKEPVSYHMDITTHINDLIETGLKPKAAIKEVARLRELKPQDVYNEFHKK